MSVVLDYSDWRPPSAQAMHNAGVVGVVRYIAPAAWGWPKAITPVELKWLRDNGFEVAFNFEQGTRDYLGGAPVGNTSGHAASTAMHELTLPPDVPVLFSFDTDIPVGQFPLCGEYFHAALTAMGGRPIATYAEGSLIEYLFSQGLLTMGWLSESTGYPGSASPTPHTVLWQHYGEQLPGMPGQYDVNTIIRPDWGQYPRPAPTPLETSMPYTFNDRVDAAPNRSRVAQVDPTTGDIVLYGGAQLLGVNAGNLIKANYPPGEHFVGAVSLAPNGFMLLSLLSDHTVAQRHYQFASKLPAPPAVGAIDYAELAKHLGANVTITAHQ